MSGYALTCAGYLTLALAIVLLEIVARRRPGSVPTFGELVGAVAATVPGRIALLALWWWAGWHFLARSSVPPVGPYPGG